MGNTSCKSSYGQKQGIDLVPLLTSPSNVKDVLYYKRILKATSFRLEITLL